MNTITLLFASFFGATAIILGAFGAHRLKTKWPPELLGSFETGVKYQMYHALALLVLGFNAPLQSTLEHWISYSFIGGTLLFSGSVYLLCWTTYRGSKWRFPWARYPLGGLLLLIGWILLGVHFLK